LTNNIFLSEDKITLDQTKSQLFKSAEETVDNVLSDVLKWIKNKFRKASKELKELVKKILDLLNNFGIRARDVLARMRKFIFRLVIANSALP
jgi:hypothetical protein